MSWLQRLSQLDSDQPSRADQYFSIGHGDFDEESGFEPKYIVWTYLGGRIECGPSSSGEGREDGGTHGSLWGHDITGKTYKGRYEPETGRLSVVKPTSKELYPVPEVVMDALRSTFDYITDVYEF